MPERVGLLLSLGIRAVPVVVGLAAQVREAQLARGLGASPLAFAAPSSYVRCGMPTPSVRHSPREGRTTEALSCALGPR